jgi:hypothetical protein
LRRIALIGAVSLVCGVCVALLKMPSIVHTWTVVSISSMRAVSSSQWNARGRRCPPFTSLSMQALCCWPDRCAKVLVERVVCADFKVSHANQMPFATCKRKKHSLWSLSLLLFPRMLAEEEPAALCELH